MGGHGIPARVHPWSPHNSVLGRPVSGGSSPQSPSVEELFLMGLTAGYHQQIPFPLVLRWRSPTPRRWWQPGSTISPFLIPTTRCGLCKIFLDGSTSFHPLHTQTYTQEDPGGELVKSEPFITLQWLTHRSKPRSVYASFKDWQHPDSGQGARHHLDQKVQQCVCPRALLKTKEQISYYWGFNCVLQKVDVLKTSHLWMWPHWETWPL